MHAVKSIEETTAVVKLEILVSKFFVSSVSIVFICIFPQNLVQCVKSTMSILYLR